MNAKKTGLPRLEAGETPKSLPRTRRTTTAKEAADVFTIAATSDTASLSAGRVRRDRAPIPNASQAVPCGRRTQYHVMYGCGACGGVHFGRSPEEIKTGKRRAACGRIVYLVVRRVYRGSAERQVAA
jgi:hypothetical protein